MGEQLVLHVLVQLAVFRDELMVQVNFPLHIFGMHCNNYAAKCMCFQPGPQQGRYGIPCFLQQGKPWEGRPCLAGSGSGIDAARMGGRDKTAGTGLPASWQLNHGYRCSCGSEWRSRYRIQASRDRAPGKMVVRLDRAETEASLVFEIGDAHPSALTKNDTGGTCQRLSTSAREDRSIDASQRDLKHLAAGVNASMRSVPSARMIPIVPSPVH